MSKREGTEVGDNTNIYTLLAAMDSHVLGTNFLCEIIFLILPTSRLCMQCGIKLGVCQLEKRPQIQSLGCLGLPTSRGRDLRVLLKHAILLLLEVAVRMLL